MSRHRSLGLCSATALVIAAMVGTGVFTTSGLLMADLGSPWAVLTVWLAGGAIAALGALSYGALARHLPESGGEYRFLSATLHPLAGYVAGWISMIVGFAAPAAASAAAFGRYAGAWLPGVDSRASGAVVILAFAGLHALHIRRGAWAHTAGVLATLLLILGFLGFAFPRLPPEEVGASAWIRSGVPGVSPLGMALILVSYSYAGWNAAVYVGGEVRDPERTLPRALLLGTALVTGLYVALNWVFLFGVPASELSGQVEVGRIVAERLGGPAWGKAMSLLVALVLMMSVSSFMMAGPRIVAQMAAAGHLPTWLRGGDGPPRKAIGTQALVALGLLATATFEELLTYVGLTLSLMTAATVAGLIRLRGRLGTRIQVVGWPWVPWSFLLLVTASCLATMWQRPSTAIASLMTVGLALAAARFWR